MASDGNAIWVDDPGWKVDWRAFVPGLQRRRCRLQGLDALTILRSAYLTFPIALTFWGLVTLLVLPPTDGSAVPLVVFGLLIAALAVHVVAPRFERPLRCTTEEDLRSDYRTRTFARIAVAHLVPLFAFVAAFVNNSSLVYVAGLVLAIPGLVRAAPTTASLLRDEADLAARGCGLSLLAALRPSPPE